MSLSHVAIFTVPDRIVCQREELSNFHKESFAIASVCRRRLVERKLKQPKLTRREREAANFGHHCQVALDSIVLIYL